MVITVETSKLRCNGDMDDTGGDNVKNVALEVVFLCG
jgi:hypothetical protein